MTKEITSENFQEKLVESAEQATSKVKIHALAKKHGYKSHNFLNILKDAGFELTNSNQSVDVEVQQQIEEFIEEVKEETVDFVGIMFDPRKKKYYPCTLKVHPKDFDEMDVKVIAEHKTVYNAIPKMDELCHKAHFFRSNPLERKLLRKERNKGK